MVHGDTKMLSAGSAEPQLQKDGIVLYSMRFCPFAERVRIVLAAKEIPHEIVNINLKSKPEWFLKLNPLGKVPTLEEPGGKLTYESLILSEYIDDKFDSGLKILPSDPYERAQQKILIEIITQKFISKSISAQFKGDEESLKGVVTGLEELEALLTDKFFTGPKVGFVDLMIWPWLHRVRPNMKAVRGIEIAKENYPKVFEWIDRMYELPFIKSTVYPAELIAKFASRYVLGEPNYDEGL